MNKKRTAALTITACFIIYTFYNYYFYKTVSCAILCSSQILAKESINGSQEDYLINTKGCQIPNYAKTFLIKEAKVVNKNCGERAVFVEKIEDYKIIFRIDKYAMKKYIKHRDTQCFYNFATRSRVSEEEDKKLVYTEWIPFQNGTKAVLLEEVITIKCQKHNTKSNKESYEDSYVFLKKLNTSQIKSNEKAWNVLLIGMDTMSRARVLNSMPQTVRYFQDYGWLDFKGYQKVGFNTFPNLMAILTGKKEYSKCWQGFSKCQDLFIWSHFADAGYLTAYGEDSLKMPDTFARYNGFQIQPTHHYLRPFFLTGEKEITNLMCAKHKPSAINLLNYAQEFASAYKTVNFFGMFWINSFSHNLDHVPSLIDSTMVRFFERLNESKVLENTIVMFLSDHGIRYGNMRVPMESYYDERLPMLFVWIPHDFRRLYEEKFKNLQLNQNRLVTPYDLYVTLEDIRNNLNTTSVKSEACPQCTSIFVEKSPYRTCADAGVDKKWCSCHILTKVNPKDNEVQISLELAVRYIQSFAKQVETHNCTTCRILKLKSILRTHSYIDTSDNKTHYVVAWMMKPGDMSYEATIMKDGDNYTVLQPTYPISAYNTLGNCALNPNDRQYCVCKKTAPHCTVT